MVLNALRRVRQSYRGKRKPEKADQPECPSTKATNQTAMPCVRSCPVSKTIGGNFGIKGKGTGPGQFTGPHYCELEIDPMGRCISRVFLSAVILSSFLFTCMAEMVLAAHEETIEGFVVKNGKDFVIEAEDGDYIVRGKDLTKFIGKMVFVKGIITESPKGDIIDIKSIESMEDTPSD